MCQRAQGNIKQLSADQVALVRYNEKGEIVYVDDATRRKETRSRSRRGCGRIVLLVTGNRPA